MKRAIGNFLIWMVRGAIVLMVIFGVLSFVLPTVVIHPLGGYEAHYDEAWTKQLNESGVRPNWSGDVPVYFSYNSASANTRVVNGRVGFGDPAAGYGYRMGIENRADIYDRDGLFGMLVVYYPDTRSYKAYSWKRAVGGLKVYHVIDWLFPEDRSAAHSLFSMDPPASIDRHIRIIRKDPVWMEALLKNAREAQAEL